MPDAWTSLWIIWGAWQLKMFRILRSLVWLLFVVRGLKFSQSMLSALKSLARTPCAVYDSQTLSSPAPPYLPLGLGIELYLLPGRLSRGLF